VDVSEEKHEKVGNRIADLPARSPMDNTEHAMPLGGRPQGVSQYVNTEKIRATQ